jgi:hypothetical protein
MHVALESNTPSSAAVLRSLLALSSLHRYGVQSQAMELKISSLKALAIASASEGSFGAKEVMQHVAAGMLLCSFEVTLSGLPCVFLMYSADNSKDPPVILHIESMDMVHCRHQGGSQHCLPRKV